MRPQPGRGAGNSRQTGRISRATEVSGTRPCTTCGAQAEGAAGPQRDNAPHRGYGEGLRGSEARTGACRSEDERGWSASHAQREASAISVCGSRSTITGAKTERQFPGSTFLPAAGGPGRTISRDTDGRYRAGKAAQRTKQCRDKAIPGRIGGAPLCFGSGAG